MSPLNMYILLHYLLNAPIKKTLNLSIPTNTITQLSKSILPTIPKFYHKNVQLSPKHPRNELPATIDTSFVPEPSSSDPTTPPDQQINLFLELSTSPINSEESATSSLDEALEISADFPSILDGPSPLPFKLPAARFFPPMPSVPPIVDPTRNITSAAPQIFIHQNVSFPPIQTQPPIPTVPNTPVFSNTSASNVCNTTQLNVPSQPPLTMSNTLKGINAMPGANSSKAPTFNGETSELLEFFELFEDLALACGLLYAEKCKTIVRYIDIQTKHFWVTLTGYESKDFTIFKTSILSQYSGAAKGLRYSIRDLE
ncbi:uncharacterized protein F5891DRAFT_974237 [Suillus fuscotomentosus]|uniref:Uncharacterized protein n=1 Tax=Suillus fuscotomentosus TaxID=1912939 RepID=A0AAD4EK28_9AGAM|nr:uncharacterized protein F5891DRAFT_974237 [Suillus fuscotomentosus]KAG1907536.1 hypothetical protein F5891DRAFT_974237 [Suillus fuscotomentosus]